MNILEDLEPVRIHVCKGQPSKNAPKWWVGFGGKISEADIDNLKSYGLKRSDIKDIEEIISCNSDRIIEMWKGYFKGNDIKIHNSVK